MYDLQIFWRYNSPSPPQRGGTIPNYIEIMSSFLSSRGNERSLTQDMLTELRCIAKADLPMVEMTDTLFCHPRVGGDLPLVMSINSTTHHEDLRLIASMQFAALPVVKLQQSSEVYCHTESDTNLHGNDIILIYNTIHPGFATPQEGNNTFLYLFPS